jgi:hypothetical protein
MGERAKRGRSRGSASAASGVESGDFDRARAESVLPVLRQILGLEGAP